MSVGIVLNSQPRASVLGASHGWSVRWHPAAAAAVCRRSADVIHRLQDTVISLQSLLPPPLSATSVTVGQLTPLRCANRFCFSFSPVQGNHRPLPAARCHLAELLRASIHLFQGETAAAGAASVESLSKLYTTMVGCILRVIEPVQGQFIKFASSR